MRQNSVEHEFKGILYVAIHICLGKTIYAHLSELDYQHKFHKFHKLFPVGGRGAYGAGSSDSSSIITSSRSLNITCFKFVYFAVAS